MNPLRSVRRLTVVAAALLAVSTLAGCATASGSTADSGSGGWSYTDDRGETVTLDQRPERVAAFTDYALGLLSLGVEPSAIFGRVPVKTDPRFEDYDLSKVAIVGNSYGEIDLEKLAESRPELIVTGIYPTDRKGTLDEKGALYAFADVDQQKQIEKIAPVVAIEVGGKGMDVIASMNRLAVALGATDDAVAEAKTAFDAASARLSAAAESGIEVTQMYADTDGIWIVKPADEPQTQLYRSLGVDYTDLNPGGKYYWDVYSWENAAKMMTGDVLLVNREGMQRADLQKQPTFADHPALTADQIHGWLDAALDYRSQATHMDELSEILETAQKL